MDVLSNRRTMKGLISAVLMLYCAVYFTAQSGNARESGANQPIAIVKGKKVFLADVAAPKELALPAFKLQYSRLPSTRELRDFASQLEIRSLASISNKVIMNDLAVQFRVAVANTEVTKSLTQQSAAISIATKQLNRRSQLLLRAIDAVIQGESKNSVYKRLLANGMSEQEWITNLAFYQNPQNRKSLEAMAKATPADFRKSLSASVKNSLREKKIERAIDLEIAKSDKRFSSLLKSSTINKQQKEYLAQKREDWWQKAYRNAIVVKDKKFDSVFSVLVKR